MDQNVIVVAPNGSGADSLIQLVDAMTAMYPVDTSHIYVGGFSGGARTTLYMTQAYPERFAAAASISCVSGPFYTDLVANLANYSYDIDLPICFAGEGLATESTNHDGQYVWFDAVKEICKLDEIAVYDGELDYSKYPYWGFPVEDEVRIAEPSGFAIWQGFLYDADGVPIVCAMYTEATTHAHYPCYAANIWNWFKLFSRDAVTNAVIYTPAQ